jgi:anti-sigma factor RsiW
MHTLEQRAIAYVLGELTDTESEAFSRELQSDARAGDAVARARRLLANLRDSLVNSALFAVPDGVRARLKGLVPLTTPTSPTAPSLVERILGLVLDSDAQPMLAGGFRGATEVRRLRFEAEGVAIELVLTQPEDIAVLPASTSRRIMGSVEGLAAGASVLLESVSSEARVLLTTDQDGYFEVSLPAETWSVSVASGDNVFRISRINLGS